MSRFRSVGIALIIFLGPAIMIYFISKTVSNHFIVLPYVGTQYTLDESGAVQDSTLFTLPEVELTRFDGTTINNDSLDEKIIILSTIQNECPGIDDCGIGITLFDMIMFEEIVKNQDNYHNVKVISILTDEDGNPVDSVSSKLKEYMSEFDSNSWWLTTGNPLPFYSFDYYGDIFYNHKADNNVGEIGDKAYTNSLVLIDAEGHVRGVSGAKSDTDIRNFFDMLKLLKKEEFNKNREKENS